MLFYFVGLAFTLFIRSTFLLVHKSSPKKDERTRRGRGKAEMRCSQRLHVFVNIRL